jgi:multidrug efflux system membrane fusion protein
MQEKNQTIPVTAASAVKKSAPFELHVIGNAEAYSTVSVKSQVNGILSLVHFKEGQDVQNGDLLFTIDPRPYQVQVSQSEAVLAKDTAQYQNALSELKRAEDLVKKAFMTQQDYEKIRTQTEMLKASIGADKAVLENARLQLSFCFIHSPVTGRTGNFLVHKGNLIRQGEQALVVINQIQPAYVTFSVPEKYLTEINKYMNAGEIKAEAILPDDEQHPESGVLVFVDNSINSTTGTIRMKALYENREKRLWPGQFVNVVLTLYLQPDATVIPSRAIQTGQKGQYVFVIKSDLTVEIRTIAAGRSMNGETIVEKGIQSGEQVVTDGQLRLLEGSKVEIKESVQGKK